MPKIVTTSKLLKVLEQLGFTEVRHHAGHVMLRQPKTRTVLALPATGKYVPEVHLKMVLRQVEGQGIASRKTFLELLEKRSPSKNERSHSTGVASMKPTLKGLTAS